MDEKPKQVGNRKGTVAFDESLVVRRGAMKDAEALTALAIRSKAHWGYPDSVMRLFQRELIITEGYMSAARVVVAEAQGETLGFAGLSTDEADPELLYLFVEPKFIGTGCGLVLWTSAVAAARTLSWDSFLIVSDPNAEAFYLRRRAERVGERDSSALPGRKLPLLRY